MPLSRDHQRLLCRVLGVGIVLGVCVLIWERNRDIISDLYDYSSIIAAAGKVEAGLKPFVDFRSSMQSATYLLAWGAEQVFGRSYRGLTFGGIAVTLLGTLALAVIWIRGFGLVLGLAVTMAIAWSGLSQHVVPFYNPVGILCLALVVGGVAARPNFVRQATPDKWLILAALVLGGVNKVNFQFLTLALAAVLVIEAAFARRISPREARQTLIWLTGFGAFIPLVLALGWTGASPVEWWRNVIGLAGERMEYLHRLFSWQVYVGPAHDLYHHIPFKPLTLVGLAVLIAVGLYSLWTIGTTDQDSPRRYLRQASVVLYTAGAALGGVMLTITNVETICLTSLAFLVAATALWLATGRGNHHTPAWPPSVTWLLAAAGLFWAVNGGLAAWAGSRVLFARLHTDRNVFVRLEHAPKALEYLNGTRLDAELHRSLLLVARELENIKKRHGTLQGVLLGPTFEWIERAFPETIIPGMPVWYHVGTSLRKDDHRWLKDQFVRHGVHHVLTHPGWEQWPEKFYGYLEAEFQSITIGPVAKLYETKRGTTPQPAGSTSTILDPLGLHHRTASNLHLGNAPVPPSFAYAASSWGDYLGQSGAWTWNWPAGLSIIEATAILARTDQGKAPAQISLRAVALPQAGPEMILWEDTVTLAGGHQSTRLPFRLTPYGQSVRIELRPRPDPEAAWHTGLRDIRIHQTVDTSREPPPSVTLPARPTPFTLADGSPVWVRTSDRSDPGPGEWKSAATEFWKPRPEGSSPWRVTFETEWLDGSGEDKTLPVVMLLWYRSGRLELLSQEAIQPGTPREVTFETWMPEPGGWLGVVARPLEPGKPFAVRLRLKSWSY